MAEEDPAGLAVARRVAAATGNECLAADLDAEVALGGLEDLSIGLHFLCIDIESTSMTIQSQVKDALSSPEHLVQSLFHFPLPHYHCGIVEHRQPLGVCPKPSSRILKLSQNQYPHITKRLLERKRER